MTPGSGAAAEASLLVGAQYHGIVTMQAHCNWLAHVLDCRMLARVAHAEGGAFIFNMELKAGIQKHFKEQLEVLEQPVEQESEDEAAGEAEDGGDDGDTAAPAAR